MLSNLNTFRVLIIFSLFLSCVDEKKEPKDPTPSSESLFTLLDPKTTGVSFSNQINEGLNANVLMYEYLYNGGGIAIGDFDQNGLEDLYFSSNMGENELYLNQGKFEFLEVTRESKVKGRPGPWKTGVTTVDINSDGLLDIYLCYSGAMPPEKRKNQLFVNLGNDENGIPVFSEQAEKYGLASEAFSNQAYFFDYDLDGDIDMLLLNHNPKSLPVLNEEQTKIMLKNDAPLQGLRLYNNDRGYFKDVTIHSGISGSALSYGLGLAISDINDDGWPDFYLSNDYTIPDYLYLNNHNGTFTDHLKEQLGHTSHFSMGNNIADMNNDGLTDIITLDMLPSDNSRQKLLLAPDNYEKFDLNLRSGFHYQYMRNMFQVNNGNGSFSEIGQLSGISNTDWSWTPLIADFNNDGFKDLYVTNGYLHDYTNLDFINYMESYVQKKGRLQREDVLEIINHMPSTNLENRFFLNTNGINFSEATKISGVQYPSNSNGAVFSDLDNDGDLEIIVNNINAPAFIFKNNSKNANYIQIKLEGSEQNPSGLGAIVEVFSKKGLQKLEAQPTKGYLSNNSHILHFGLGTHTKIDSIKVTWSPKKTQLLKNPDINKRIILSEKNATPLNPISLQNYSYFTKAKSPIEIKANNQNHNDFKRQSLLTKQLSQNGALLWKGDFNKDNIEDLIIGGTHDNPSIIYLFNEKGDAQKKILPQASNEYFGHSTAVAIFDANNDGHQDIYMGHGGYHDLQPNDHRLADVLYLGNGSGQFSVSTSALPSFLTNTSSVSVADFNNDGSIDIFVGGGAIPGEYPKTAFSKLFLNDGKANFEDVTDTWGSALKNLKLVTESHWDDINNDGHQDLIVVGEWSTIKIYINNGKSLIDQTNVFFNQNYFGWWNTFTLADINNDGKKDILAGNVGRNIQLKSSVKEPVELYYDDFDKNGSVDPILSSYVEGISYPFVTRDELLNQLSTLKSKFNTYESYAKATTSDVLRLLNANNAPKLKADFFESAVFIMNENGQFELLEMPPQFQYAPIKKFLVKDIDNDGYSDIITLGNEDDFKLRIGKIDASYGQLFKGNAQGTFKYVPQPLSGLNISGSVKSAVWFRTSLLIGVQNDSLQFYSITPSFNK